MLIDGFMIGVAAAVGDPGAIAGQQNRLHGRNQAAGRHDGLKRSVAKHVFVRLTIRNHKETAFFER